MVNYIEIKNLFDSNEYKLKKLNLPEHLRDD